jgi:hypothetical protein
VLVTPYAIDTGINRIYPILLLAIPMGFLKGVNFYGSENVFSKNVSDVENVEINNNNTEL